MKLPMVVFLVILVLAVFMGYKTGVLGSAPDESVAQDTTEQLTESKEAQTKEVKGWALIAAGALLVDVRTADEFSTGHLDGALNIPHDQVAARLAEFGADKSRDVVLYCRSGNRAGLAETVLAENGFSAVFNAGGYEPMLAAKPATD